MLMQNIFFHIAKTMCKLSVVLVLVGMILTVSGRADVVPDVHKRMHEQLQAEQDNSQRFQAMVDSLTNQNEETEEPFNLYSTLDLDAGWDDDHVDPLLGKAGIAIPDSAFIPMKGFVPPVIGRVNSPYGWRKRRMHKGVDLKLYPGDTVRAAWDGKVRIRKFDRRGYGYYYVLRHPNGMETVYGHLSKFIVNQNDTVRAGQPIGLGGSTGRSTGPHLHLEFRYYGIALDPAQVIDLNTFRPKSEFYEFRQKRARQVAQGLAGNGTAAYHRVKQGDTLAAIARRYGTTVSRLCDLNGIRSRSTLRIGQRIRYK
ncbi:MAG: peptidoglycan DD-metalloendopeptidase family protein [Bacteroidales bacterium]|nr:peptidoglycan DD-metalloendopeptidase family protein [Bacteroidales bacterium]